MTSNSTRTVLFLQGPPSLFWKELADCLEQAGHRTLKVHMNAGDLIFWRKSGALHYRGRLENWRKWLRTICLERGVTDIVYFADRLPYHVGAKAIATELGIRSYACEFGYLRPDWITFERGGMGVYSHFPKDPDAILEAPRNLLAPEEYPQFSHSFANEAFNDVAYNLTMVFLSPLLYPFYKSDKYHSPVIEYLSWIPRLLRNRNAARHADGLVDQMKDRKYFLLALQLQSDYQIRDNSPYTHLSDMLDEVITSFAFHADADCHLVIKIHPLDNGLIRWEKIAQRCARHRNVSERVHVIDGGNLSVLLKHTLGTVIVNSTVGIHSIRAGRPTKVLGIAVFDVPGLTDQRPLSQFWADPMPVDRQLAQDFLRLMRDTIQVKGSFYDPNGRTYAAMEIVRRIVDDRVNQPGAFVDPPPRIDHARQIGVPVVI